MVFSSFFCFWSLFVIFIDFRWFSIKFDVFTTFEFFFEFLFFSPLCNVFSPLISCFPRSFPCFPRSFPHFPRFTFFQFCENEQNNRFWSNSLFLSERFLVISVDFHNFCAFWYVLLRSVEIQAVLIPQTKEARLRGFLLPFYSNYPWRPGFFLVVSLAT